MTCVRIPATLCSRCRGVKRLCGLRDCPLLQRFRHVSSGLATRGSISAAPPRLFGSTPPSVIVGERGYPYVRIYLSVPPGIVGDAAKIYEDPRRWWGRYCIEELVALRSSMIAGFSKIHVRQGIGVLENSEVLYAALSSKPVDIELELSSKPLTRVAFDDRAKPIPPSAPLKSLRIASNPTVPKVLEKTMCDDVPAHRAVAHLYESGVDVYTIHRALSLGTLGRRRSRRLVPTRWAITAVDRILSQHFLSRIRGRETVSTSMLFYEEYLGNRFWIYVEPSTYEMHWIELWHQLADSERNVIAVYNRERHSGSVDYLDGGFEAAKMPVLEYLASIGRQGKVVIVREVLPSYSIPVGNWHIRESVRNALRRGPIAKGVSMSEVLTIIEGTSRIAASVLRDYVKCLSKARILDFFVKK